MSDREDDGTEGPSGQVPPMRRIEALGGADMPALGLGTWTMGERRSGAEREVAALRLGFDLGMTLVDTAEMYADGGAEEVVGEALRGRRDEVFVVTKVLPENASRKGTVEAAEGSLRRLGIDRIDLYLLHWKGSHPLHETLEAFGQLVDEGKIRHYGVSNFFLADMHGAAEHPLGRGIAANQVKYNLRQRTMERDLLPWCIERRVAVMAHTPLDRGHLPLKPALSDIARRHGTTPECIALAWTLRQPMVVSIPKATNPDHVRANRAALSLALSDEDLAELDRDFPPATRGGA